MSLYSNNLTQKSNKKKQFIQEDKYSFSSSTQLKEGCLKSMSERSFTFMLNFFFMFSNRFFFGEMSYTTTYEFQQA